MPIADRYQGPDLALVSGSRHAKTMTTLTPEFLLIDPVLRPAARRYLERVKHLERGTACYHCGTALHLAPPIAQARERRLCPACAVWIDHRRLHSVDNSAKHNRLREIAGYLLAGMADVEIGRRLAWPKAATLCRGPLLQFMQQAEPELAEWWHAHLERDEPVLPVHLRNDRDRARAAMAAGQGPRRLLRGRPVDNDNPPLGILDAMVAGLGTSEFCKRHGLAATTVVRQWHAVIQTWLAHEWPALAAWAKYCLQQRRRALCRAAAIALKEGRSPVVGSGLAAVHTSRLGHTAEHSYQRIDRNA